MLVTAGGPHYTPLLQMTPDQLRTALGDHAVLALEVARNAVGKMRPGGTLLLMGGTGGRRIRRDLGIISAATAVLPAFTATLALELAPVRVNLIAAGFVDTPLSASLLGDGLEARRDELRAHPAHRAGRRTGRRRGPRRAHHDQHRAHRRDVRHRRRPAIRLVIDEDAHRKTCPARQGSDGMPWFPDFYGAVELARKQTRAAGLADPVAQYFTALNNGRHSCPGNHLAGRGGGLRPARRRDPWPPAAAPVRPSQSGLAGRAARTDRDGGVPPGSAGGRWWSCSCIWTVPIRAATIRAATGTQLAWPVAVVAESPDDLSVVFRTYCSQWPVDGRRPVRPPILDSGHVRPGDVVGRYQAALEAGDADCRGRHLRAGRLFPRAHRPTTHRGAAALRSFFTSRFSAGGGIGLQECAVTDDGVRCALEYNCVRWGSHQLPPQAGLGRLRTRPRRTAERGPGLRRRAGTGPLNRN